jgi:hypothetical protein
LFSFFIEDIHTAKQWLANDGLTGSFEVVLSKWQYTSELRKIEILNPDSHYLSDIFESWPVLQGPRGFELVCFMYFYLLLDKKI